MVTNQPHDEEFSISDSEQHRDESGILPDARSPFEQGIGMTHIHETHHVAA